MSISPVILAERAAWMLRCVEQGSPLEAIAAYAGCSAYEVEVIVAAERLSDTARRAIRQAVANAAPLTSAQRLAVFRALYG